MTLPPTVDHETWRKELDALRVREKAATRELDAIAAQRRRLPMVKLPDYTLVGAEGPVRLADIFDGKSQLIVYNHMWFPGEEWQCGGCTSFTSSFTRLGFLDNYDARFVIVTQGPIDEALAYAKRVGNTMEWYSTADSPFGADVDAPPGAGFAVNVFLRDGDTVYRTWHTNGRGTEQLTYTFALADVLPYGRREEWQDSPEGWPQTPTYSGWLDSPDIARLYGPPSESPTQTVQRLFPLLAAGKTEEAAALFADSVSFSIPHPAGIPWVPEVDSAAGMRTFFELLGTHVQPKEFDLRQVIAEGDDVILIGRMVSEVKKTGRDIDTAFALHATVRDGKITRYHLYEDTHAVAKAYFDN